MCASKLAIIAGAHARGLWVLTRVARNSCDSQRQPFSCRSHLCLFVTSGRNSMTAMSPKKSTSKKAQPRHGVEKLSPETEAARDEGPRLIPLGPIKPEH